jgi:hypothetical protein
MKYLKLSALFLFVHLICSAQQDEPGKKTAVEKVTEKSKKINDKTRDISNASNEVANQAKQAADNVKNIAANIKTVLKIFEPILSFHFKKNKGKKAVTDNSQQQTNETASTQNTQTPAQTENNASGSYPAATQNNDAAYGNNTPASNYGQPESDTYNQDGTMNMGQQNNGKYGNCLNLLEAKVMGMGEAEDNPEKVDLIFLSQYGGSGFSFSSPFEAPTINEGVGVKSWKERNETELAETKLTIAQFEKITTNTSLMNAVKNTRGYSGYVFTPNKMDGRVFAIKLLQDNKEVYALLAVYKQFGTGGSNGYLQIKIKVQGIDKNADGNPDPNAYTRQ